MNNPSDIIDEKSSKNLDKTNVYSDIDGTFECILIKYGDDNENILDEIQMTIIHEKESKYSLLIQKLNNEPIVDVTDSNIELVKSKFDSIFHNYTGNYWKYRDKFSRTHGHYCLFTNDLDSSSSSEEKQVGLNQINKIPKFYSTERAFFNFQTNAIEKTYTYINDGADWEITLPDISRENEIISALLNVRKSVLRIATLYERDSTAQIFFGSGFLLTDRIVLTCAHNFDVIVWANEKVRYSRIYVCFCDPANETLFSFSNPSPRLREAKLIRRGLQDDNICDYDEIKCETADLALLELNNPATHLQPNEYFDPKLNLLSSTSNHIPINSKLYLIGYNGELKDHDDLNPYKHLKGFQNLTIDKLNLSHKINQKSVAIGHLIQESSLDNQYAMHNCSTLSGTSGALMLDSTGKFAGIHIGISNSRKSKTKNIFFNNETFNKFIPVDSKPFREFIDQTILPNINNDELKQKWLFNSK